MKKTAEISECGKFRYTLRRSGFNLMKFQRSCLFVMLNPSTADASIDYPTIRKCIHYAERENCTSLTVVNLFALRSTDPDQLPLSDRRDTENEKHLLEQISLHRTGLVVLAWGSHRSVKNARTEWVKLQLFIAGVTPKCLGINKDGNPKHPLYISKNQPLLDYAH